MKRIGLTLALALAVGIPAGTSANHLSPSNFKNSAKYCKALREEMHAEPFARAFGTNQSKSNAYGKCVSRKGRIDTVETPPPSECTLELVCTEPPLPVHAFGGADAVSKHPDNGSGKSKAK